MSRCSPLKSAWQVHQPSRQPPTVSTRNRSSCPRRLYLQSSAVVLRGLRRCKSLSARRLRILDRKVPALSGLVAWQPHLSCTAGFLHLEMSSSLQAALLDTDRDSNSETQYRGLTNYCKYSILYPQSPILIIKAPTLPTWLPYPVLSGIPWSSNQHSRGCHSDLMGCWSSRSEPE